MYAKTNYMFFEIFTQFSVGLLRPFRGMMYYKSLSIFICSGELKVQIKNRFL